MPRKTKKQTEKESNINKEELQKTSTKKVATNRTASSKASKKSTTTKKSVASKTSSTKAKATTTKKSSTTNKVTAKNKTTAKKEPVTKKSSTAKKKASTTRKKKSNSTIQKKSEIVEYYDLPYRYNQTIVKVLAQTPTTLFIYWDISDKDRENYKKQYGENFFENSKPVLIVHNDTLGYSFNVDINDFANSWYLHVADSKCDYRIELGRRPIQKNENLNVDYVYISTSNHIESPNDRILFDNKQKMVYFKDVQSGNQYSKPINSFSFIRNMGKIYDIYDMYNISDLYKLLYQNENIEELYNTYNPSSGNPSSRKFFFKV